MSEISPGNSEVGYEHKLKVFSKLPHYYQCLGKACAAAGILDKFYGVVDAGFDYGQALGALRHELEGKLEAPDVDTWLEYFGIPSEYEEGEVE